MQVPEIAFTGDMNDTCLWALESVYFCCYMPCMQVPEIAFTGDTTAEFLDSDSPLIEDVLRARLLIMEMTFLDDSHTIEEVGRRTLYV